MKIFDLDSPLMNVLNKMADLMWLNILTLICCIPIITAGAAFTSMHYVALKIVRNEESYITRSFFKSFKTNFRQATLIWLLILLIAAVLGGDYYIITKSGIQFSSVLVILIMAAAVLVICTTLYVFPVLAKFDNTIMGTIRNAFIMSILQLPKTVVMFVMAFFPLIIYLVSLRLIPIIFLFGFVVVDRLHRSEKIRAEFELFGHLLAEPLREIFVRARFYAQCDFVAIQARLFA